jgi:putative colanic acid biosynthesis UDP-glucose lipid carrier transferase
VASGRDRGGLDAVAHLLDLWGIISSDLPGPGAGHLPVNYYGFSGRPTLSALARRQFRALGAPGFPGLAGDCGHPHDAGLYQQDLGALFPDSHAYLDGDSPHGPGGSALTGLLGLAVAAAQGRNSRTVVIAGAGDLGQRLAKNVVETPWLGMRLLGFFDDRVTGEIHLDHQGYPVLGTLDDMIGFVQQQQVVMVYLALPLRAEDRLREVVESLQDTTASVYYVPDVFIFSLFSASLTDLRGIPLVALWETPFFGVNGWLKRAEDLVLASLILIIVSPLLVLIALGVKLTSPGPIIFRQRRYGLDGSEIIVYKFRTMKVCEDGQHITQTTKDDSRVTPLGRWLRRTSLDELPQFFNVLNGSMSIVGPRPHAVAHNEYYRRLIPGYMLRHKVRPGLTGWAQVNGWRGETETLEKMEKRVEFDLEYLRRWSLWFDLKIILLTIFRGFKDSHAY